MLLVWAWETFLHGMCLKSAKYRLEEGSAIIATNQIGWESSPLPRTGGAAKRADRNFGQERLICQTWFPDLGDLGLPRSRTCWERQNSFSIIGSAAQIPHTAVWRSFNSTYMNEPESLLWE